MRDHNYAPREVRLVVMNDHEIQHAARCYRCGGHHIERVVCGTCGVWNGVTLLAATALALGAVALGVF